MSGRFVRASKYRHVYGQPAKKELCYDNIKISTNAWDSNLIKANGKFISVNWNSSGGGAFAVIPVGEVGKAPDQVPLFRGHTATVLDTDFNPFNDNILISGSDDTKVGIWKVPDDYSFHNYTNSDGDVKDISPVALYSGHKRKVGHVQFHPTAENVAASSSLDYTIKLWDVESGKDNITLTHKDLVTSFSFNYNGNLLATTSRDRQLRVWDIRANKIISEGPGHTGAKASRVVWLGNSDRIGTTGFSRLSDRQLGVWDSTNISAGPLGGFYTVDASSGILIPFYDDSNKIFYVGGKGDGNIRYFEFQDDELFPLSEFHSTDAQRGLAFAPKKTVNVVENEILKAYKTVRDTLIEPISFIVPRKSEVFQDDIYPDAPSGKAALTAEEWFGGKSVDGPILFSLESLYNGTEPEFKPSTARASSPKKEESAKPKEPELQKNETPVPEKQESAPVVKEVPPRSDHSSPKSNLDDLLQKTEVNSLLKKAADLDDGHEEKTETTWDDEDDELKKPDLDKVSAKEEQASPVKVPVKQEIPVESKIEPKVEPVESKVEPKVEQVTKEVLEEEQKEIKKEKPKEDSKPVSRETTATASAAEASTPESTGKPLTLKGSIQKLASVVEYFEGVVSRLEAANLEKDERIKALEEKVQQLIEKK